MKGCSMATISITLNKKELSKVIEAYKLFKIFFQKPSRQMKFIRVNF